MFGIAACSHQIPVPEMDIVPAPRKIEAVSGTFDFRGTPIALDTDFGTDVAAAVTGFAEDLSAASGETSGITAGNASRGLVIKYDPSVAPENYIIKVRPQRTVVKASDLNGVIYSLETIKQMLPVSVYSGKVEAGADWSVPCVSITDGPRFGYRGLMLDVSRHFFSKDEVKKIIDVMVMHKLNRLHWHLTDDQGWRVEIRRYPELTSKGSVRKGTVIRKEWGHYDGIPYGGFYTQDEIREVVAYAASKGVTIVPEIDLPGHMMGALAAYPELGCTGGPYDVWCTWGVSEEVLCAGKEETMVFLENVLGEIMELFPSEYIHIGGDECPKVRWESCPACQAKIRELGLQDDERHSAEHYLQSYVTERIGKFLESHGRKFIGWDEILEGKLPEGATVMSWRGVDGGVAAANMGHDAIMTPTSHLYFDYYQSEDTENEPFGIGGLVTLEKVYSFEPVAEGLDVEKAAHIIGVQANMWTEYVLSDSHLEYMILPRLAALSEVQWCRPENRDWNRFRKSMDRIVGIYTERGYNFRPLSE